MNRGPVNSVQALNLIGFPSPQDSWVIFGNVLLTGMVPACLFVHLSNLFLIQRHSNFNDEVFQFKNFLVLKYT